MEFATSSSSNTHRSRWIDYTLLLLAIVFAAATALYTYFLMAARQSSQLPSVELGLDYPFKSEDRAFVVTNVTPNSPAERAGIKIGDKVVAFDGRQVTDSGDQVRAYKFHRPGESVRLTILRPGVAAPLELTGVLRPNSLLASPGSLREAVGLILRDSVPLVFSLVGLIILLLRPQDRNVWLLACFFAGIISAAGFPVDYQTAPAQVRLGLEVYNGVFLGLIGASFYFLCAVFPASSPLDRRLPWLKWVGVLLGLAVIGDTIRPDISRPFATFSRFMSAEAAGRFGFGLALTFLVLGLVSLAANYFFAGGLESRRKIRVIFWGTVVGFGPPLLRAAVQQYSAFQSPDWLEMILNAILLLVPTSFAYAVFKQHVLDIPVLLQRGARYVLVQRGFLLLLCFASFGLALVFAAALPQLPQLPIGTGQSSNVALGTIFGTALLWGGSQVHKQVSAKIDRAFFRRAYDARVILEDLAENSRTATSRESLAYLLLNQLNAALQPASLGVYLATANGDLEAAAGVVPPEFQTIRRGLPLLEQLARRGEPWELPPEGLEKDPNTKMLAPLHSGCLVPILSRKGELVGLLALGPRLSEEPYSGEDTRLLASVASQAGMALENFHLAEDIAEKLETERRTAREMEIARDVQARLLPQTPPDLKTLECAGRCLQAKSVGGDYFDFLELGPGQTGLVLADVSGKGVHAALLMANLQAHLRSLTRLTGYTGERMTPLDLTSRLEEVNRILWKSTAAQHYATLFFGLYDDDSRRLTFVNCGHTSPILLRAGGDVERLPSSATVIGLFENCECVARETDLAPGDLLAIFSDGVTEAMRGEEEFGESRLLDDLRATRMLPLEEVVTTVFRSVQQFSGGDQSDDLTLVVSRGKQMSGC
ncbi:MAG: SpoIIE family protein phosphatase [Bryobacteraceae bacterium]